MKRIINAANGVTLVRVILLPLLVISYNRSDYGYSLLLIAIMASTDFLDGKVARLLGSADDFGARFDVLADCMFVFIFQAVLLANHDWPLHIFLLSVLSALTFLFGPLLQQHPTRGAIGRFAGGSIMLLFTFRVLGDGFSYHPVNLLIRFGETVSVLVLLCSIIENANAFMRARRYSGERV